MIEDSIEVLGGKLFKFYIFADNLIALRIDLLNICAKRRKKSISDNMVLGMKRVLGLLLLNKVNHVKQLLEETVNET